MESKLARLLSEIRSQPTAAGFCVSRAQFQVLETCSQRVVTLETVKTQVKALRAQHLLLLAKFSDERAALLSFVKAANEEITAQVGAMCNTTQEMMKFVDRELRRTLKPVIPTSIILSNLQYPAMNDLTDLDSPKNPPAHIDSEGKVEAKAEAREPRPDPRPDLRTDPRSDPRTDPRSDPKPDAKAKQQLESSGKTDHIQLLIATLETLGKDLMKLRNILHAFYYKIGGKPMDKPREYHDTVPSIWGDAEIIDGGVSPLGASLAPDFSFTKAAYTEDLKNILNVGDQDLFSATQKERLVAGILSIQKKRETQPLPSSARRDIRKAVDRGHFKLDLENTVLRKCVAADELPITIREKLVYEYINSSRQSSRNSVTIEELLKVRQTNRQETDSSALPSLDGLQSVTPKHRKEFEVSAASYTNSLFAKQQEPLCLSPEELPEEAEPLNSSLASTIDDKMEEKRKSEAKQRLPALWGPQMNMVGDAYLPPIGSSKQPDKRLKRSVSNVPPRLHGRKGKPLPKVAPAKEPKRRMKRVSSVENDVVRGRGKHKAVRSVGDDLAPL